MCELRRAASRTGDSPENELSPPTGRLYETSSPGTSAV